MIFQLSEVIKCSRIKVVSTLNKMRFYRIKMLPHWHYDIHFLAWSAFLSQRDNSLLDVLVIDLTCFW